MKALHRQGKFDKILNHKVVRVSPRFLHPPPELSREICIGAGDILQGTNWSTWDDRSRFSAAGRPQMTCLPRAGAACMVVRRSCHSTLTFLIGVGFIG